MCYSLFDVWYKKVCDNITALRNKVNDEEIVKSDFFNKRGPDLELLTGDIKENIKDIIILQYFDYK